MTSKGKSKPPKLNKFMHPKNPYRTPPSFKKLATEYPEFRVHCTYDVSGKVHLDFKNPLAVRALTTCLLDQDFDLKVSIPENRLVPTLPLRLNYLLWVQDLLTHAVHLQPDHSIVGVDIGCGALCIYPLLASRKLGWSMIATEMDQMNYNSAMDNLLKNNLNDQVFVKKVGAKTILNDVIDNTEIIKKVCSMRSQEREEEDKSLNLISKEQSKSQNSLSKEQSKSQDLISREEEEKNTNLISREEEKSQNLISKQQIKSQMLISKEKESQNLISRGEEGINQNLMVKEIDKEVVFDFTMCNPPFFGSEEETHTMTKSKKSRGEPISAPTGALHEKVTEGGEVAFITQMINESKQLYSNVRIFTTLIGTKAHIKAVKNALNLTEPKSQVITEFCQGRTMRWGIAWTYHSGIDLCNVKSKKDMMTKKPLLLNIHRSRVSVYSVSAVWSLINSWLRLLKVKVHVFKSTKYFVSANVKAYKPTWLHLRRKKREEKRKKEASVNGGDKTEVNVKKRGKEEEVDEVTVKKLKLGDVEEESEREDSFNLSGECVEEMEDSLNDEEDKIKDSLNMSGKAGKREDKIDSMNLSSNSDNLDRTEKLDTSTEESPVKFKLPSIGDTKVTGSKMDCILRSNFQVKQNGGLICLEAYYLDGSSGKDGLNQILQFIKNKLVNAE